MLDPGTLFAERFSIERLAGRGGMGFVFRAQDLRTKSTVALKIVPSQGNHSTTDRFLLEAYALSALSHPGIVRYIAHGEASNGDLYLAMEWLEGEDLAARLKRGRLTVEESIALLTQIADALAEVHQKGLIHRDIKPSNIFLCGQDLSSSKLLDFGIARIGPADGLTRTGAIMGTPGYLAPEQSVRGAKGLDASADIFALGCVLFECLTGRPTFVGGNVLAVLSKILLEEAPKVSAHRDDIPPELESLLEQMLSKSPSSRPKNAGALLAALRRLKLSAPIKRAANTLTQSEQQLFAVVLVEVTEATSLAATLPDQSTMLEQMRSRAETLGGKLTPLINGALLFSFSVAESPSDLAVQAARAALALRVMWPRAPIALALGHGEEQRLIGDVIERATALVKGTSFLMDSEEAPIWVDEVSARFLRSRFELAQASPGMLLRGERSADSARTLLGRPTACVGRERELLLLESAYQSVLEDQSTKGILLTAPPGVGKSRLLHEFLRRLPDAPLILLGQGDPMRAGSAFGLIGQALQELFALIEGEPIEERQRRLLSRLSVHLSGQELARIAGFFGEMLGVPFSDEHNPQLRAARQDALLMSDQIQWSFEAWLRAECASRPVLLVFEDLHWGDLPSVRLAEMSLRADDLPLMVLASARPSVHELFPSLASARLEELKLPELSKKAAERLIREVLREKATPEITQLLLERAAGNAFYLEEMLRAVTEGQTELPLTVLAMASARLEMLPPEARRTLRAASIFGERAWRGGLSKLLQQSDLDSLLRLLCEREVLVRRSPAKFMGEEEYRFRHALLRDAAYLMLTAEDKKTGHRLAAEWLESVGEQDARTIAEHLERGGATAPAVSAYHRAAEQAFEGNDLESVLSCVKKGLSCGAQGEERGVLRLLEAEAYNWRAMFDEALTSAEEALSLLPAGELHLRALGEAIVASGRRGDTTRLVFWAERLLALPLSSPPSLAQASCLARCLPRLYRASQGKLSLEVLRQLEQLGQSVSPADGRIWLWCRIASMLSAIIGSRYDEWCDILEGISATALSLGDMRTHFSWASDLGFAYINAGDVEKAERLSREVLRGIQRYQLDRLSLPCKAGLCFTLMLREKNQEALDLAEQALSDELTRKDPQAEVMLRCFAARIHLTQGDISAAQEQLTLAQPHYQQEFHGPFMADARSRLLRTQGRYEEALREVRPYGYLTGANGKALEWDLALTCVELLALNGEHTEAKSLLEKSKARITHILSQYKTPSSREKFLSKPSVAALLSLGLPAN